ncbi:hypothetical protein LB505_000968 [Fusarium chuoi]|nr:hypothetical protein LB505_000968 [Fusarium chuoi]
MAGIVEDYLESPGMDNDTDDVFPCKGCGEPVTDGIWTAFDVIPVAHCSTLMRTYYFSEMVHSSATTAHIAAAPAAIRLKT